MMILKFYQQIPSLAEFIGQISRNLSKIDPERVKKMFTIKRGVYRKAALDIMWNGILCLSNKLTLERESKLKNSVENILYRFPKTFDSRLISGLDRLVANASKNFVFERSTSHLMRLLIIQFFLQKRMEAALEKKDSRLFTKFFCTKSHICLMAVLPFFEAEQLIAQDCLK